MGNTDLTRQIAEMAKNGQGVKHWDSNQGGGQKSFDSGRDLSGAKNFDVIAMAGASNFTFLIDNASSPGGGLGIACNAVLYDIFQPIWQVNDGTLVPNDGANEIIVTLDNKTGNIIYTLASDATKFMVVSCDQRSMLANMNSSMIRPFMLRNILYESDVTVDQTQPRNKINFVSNKNVFGTTLGNSLTPAQFKPIMLQTPGVLNIDIEGSNKYKNGFRVNAETVITHSINPGQIIQMNWAVTMINESNISL